MALHFCLSVRFLDAEFHGRAGDQAPEWPPSPLRVFQALIASAARRDGGKLSSRTQDALEWLESQKSPIVIAPEATPGSGYRLSVPNNAMDVVAKAWVRGNEGDSGDANPATHRTMKSVRPMLLNGDAVHYIWQLPEQTNDEIRDHVKSLSVVAAGIAALGWGLDMAIGHGVLLSDEQVEELHGERWVAFRGLSDGGLRTPVSGTLENLTNRYEAFIERLGPNGFIPPPPLSTYARSDYRRLTDSPARSFAAFSLLRLDASGFQPFDAVSRGLTVAGMMRSAVKAAAVRSGWLESKVDSFVLGHGETLESGPPVRRFAYLPVPSIETRNDRRTPRAGSVRRVIVMTFHTRCDEEITWAKRMISGQELQDEVTKTKRAVLSLIPESDGIVRQYTQPAATWATVMPLVLPGFDDPRHYRRRLKKGVDSAEQRELLERMNERTDALLRKALTQVGFSELLANNAAIEWRKTGFWPGTDPADRYGVPDHLKRYPRYHVKIQWRDAHGRSLPVRGPICVGGGRYYGLGLFAAI